MQTRTGRAGGRARYSGATERKDKQDYEENSARQSELGN